MHEATGLLGKLVDDVLAGKEVILARAGRPVARIVPLRHLPMPRKLGALAGKVHLPDDFDAPPPDAVVRRFERRKP